MVPLKKQFERDTSYNYKIKTNKTKTENKADHEQESRHQPVWVPNAAKSIATWSVIPLIHLIAMRVAYYCLHAAPPAQPVYTSPLIMHAVQNILPYYKPTPHKTQALSACSTYSNTVPYKSKQKLALCLLFYDISSSHWL